VLRSSNCVNGLAGGDDPRLDEERLFREQGDDRFVGEAAISRVHVHDSIDGGPCRLCASSPVASSARPYDGSPGIG